MYGITFRGLGLPDKFAYAMDLTMRFIPTFGRDFQLTMDAQRARGYEIEKLEGGLLAQVRKLAPLIVPVTIHAIIGSEDIIDAMDLRAFGVQPRTWLIELTYRRRDQILIALGVTADGGVRGPLADRLRAACGCPRCCRRSPCWAADARPHPHLGRPPAAEALRRTDLVDVPGPDSLQPLHPILRPLASSAPPASSGGSRRRPCGQRSSAGPSCAASCRQSPCRPQRSPPPPAC